MGGLELQWVKSLTAKLSLKHCSALKHLHNLKGKSLTVVGRGVEDGGK